MTNDSGCKDKKQAKASGSNNNSNNDNNNNNNVNRTNTGPRSSSDTRSCAACKYQRRRCAPDCAFSRYFPPDHQKQFLNSHRLFGLRNMMKIYNTVEPNQRDIAIKSMIFEANIRANDPVGGCHRIIKGLQQQIDLCTAELVLVRRHLREFQNPNIAGIGPAVNSEAGMGQAISEPGYVPALPSTQYLDFNSYIDLDPLYEGIEGCASPVYEGEGIEGMTSQRVEINQTASLVVNGSEEVKSDLIELSISRNEDEPKAEDNNNAAQPKQGHLKDKKTNSQL